MKLIHVLAAAATTFVATPSIAAPVAGGRVEAIIGWDNSQFDVDEFGFGDVDRDGFLYGIRAGYDFGVSDTVSIGVDAELTDSTADVDLVDGNDFAEVSVGRDIYLGARVTGAVAENFNLYGMLGYTNTRIRADARVGTTTFSDAANADGIRAGLGGQYYVASNVFVGLEYRYSNYEADFSRHQVAATLGFRF
ncbi:outer membrane protein [Sphingosinicella terrae]|uniref:outer membrane protein n=1 Tax=Sphingosinicella terrae TaxID=2172047 RepID=UPI000E0D9417|nr:porin family protein [Sphingosinicella terrae]